MRFDTGPKPPASCASFSASCCFNAAISRAYRRVASISSSVSALHCASAVSARSIARTRSVASSLSCSRALASLSTASLSRSCSTSTSPEPRMVRSSRLAAVRRCTSARSVCASCRSLNVSFRIASMRAITPSWLLMASWYCGTRCASRSSSRICCPCCMCASCSSLNRPPSSLRSTAAACRRCSCASSSADRRFSRSKAFLSGAACSVEASSSRPSCSSSAAAEASRSACRSAAICAMSLFRLAIFFSASVSRHDACSATAWLRSTSCCSVLRMLCLRRRSRTTPSTPLEACRHPSADDPPC
mmetsp:Transcript_21929/g.56200  ORF Transcript_21929/g.56200 Transcript_21929/m.56200 type:complete len:303 (+) Transcript_21929:322-1230(+)